MAGLPRMLAELPSRATPRLTHLRAIESEFFHQLAVLFCHFLQDVVLE